MFLKKTTLNDCFFLNYNPGRDFYNLRATDEQAAPCNSPLLHLRPTNTSSDQEASCQGKGWPPGLVMNKWGRSEVTAQQPQTCGQHLTGILLHPSTDNYSLFRILRWWRCTRHLESEEPRQTKGPILSNFLALMQRLFSYFRAASALEGWKGRGPKTLKGRCFRQEWQQMAACHTARHHEASRSSRYSLKVLQMSDTALKTLSEKFTFTFTYFILGSWSLSSLCWGVNCSLASACIPYLSKVQWVLRSQVLFFSHHRAWSDQSFLTSRTARIKSQRLNRTTITSN